MLSGQTNSCGRRDCGAKGFVLRTGLNCTPVIAWDEVIPNGAEEQSRSEAESCSQSWAQFLMQLGEQFFGAFLGEVTAKAESQSDLMQRE